MLGSMAKSFHLGAAARNGLAAALLARNNFSASERAIEGPRGFAHVLGDKPAIRIGFSYTGEGHRHDRQDPPAPPVLGHGNVK